MGEKKQMISVDNLFVSTENPRFNPVENQKEA